MHHGRHRDQRECVRGAVAHLAVHMAAAERLGQRHGGDQFRRAQVGVQVGRSAGQAIEVGDGNGPVGAVRVDRFHHRVQQPHGHGHVARVRGDAGVALAHDGVATGKSAEGGATGAWRTLVAGLVGIVEIWTAGALQQVAGRGGLVAQLRAGAGQQGPRQHAVIAPHGGIGRQVGIAHQGADAQAALGRGFDAVQAQAVDVHQVGRRFDLELHQVEQVGAACNEARAGSAGRDGCRFGNCGGALIGKGSHERLPATSVMASMMLE
ncbi:hypothetical protein DUPY_22520 [Duganella phyllosphaerae]|uniref:Uncharacterized protein n=1 Tax=Duganella phyllosphaerae TaxID=762836 RepID=A0A1E7WP87_9BURK|nr:hypothetical protein DUPY_22520 [Duganella phyllosphaerae]